MSIRGMAAVLEEAKVVLRQHGNPAPTEDDALAALRRLLEESKKVLNEGDSGPTSARYVVCQAFGWPSQHASRKAA